MTNSLQFSLVVSRESGVMSRVIKLLMEFRYMPLSRKTLETTDPEQPNLVVIAKGNGSLKSLLSRLKKLKGVISISKIEDYEAKKKINSKTNLFKSFEQSKTSINYIKSARSLRMLMKSSQKQDNNNLFKSMMGKVKNKQATELSE